ncbi:MAG TPA: lytic murein transglycosylase B [Acidiferrobacteraceae bacterium]|nr:lytic murein transglycosylase B [Acidiferrobacteraceae bacterium]
MNLNRFVTTTCATLYLGMLFPMVANAIVVERSPKMKKFVEFMVVKHGMKRVVLERVLRGARIRKDIVAAIKRPAERDPWYIYRRNFVSDEYAKSGADYWKKHRAILERAYRTYGVPPEIVIAILGVETRYGKSIGKYPVIDALVTLSLKSSQRKAFFLRELEQFFLLSREEGLNPLEVKGSYAGAIGVPQFISSSYRRYAVDFDSDNRRDLLTNVADIIGSTANYFYKHGWKQGDRIISPVSVGRSKISVDEGDMVPRYTISQLKKRGVLLTEKLSGERKVSLIKLRLESGDAYNLGFYNFYVITRYNHNVRYAMAVYELSQLIREHYYESS